LIRLAPTHDAELVLPRLGEPVEPSRVEHVTPWWRVTAAQPVLDEEALSLPPTEGGDAVTWPMD
jgi:hypothetical protein